MFWVRQSECCSICDSEFRPVSTEFFVITGWKTEEKSTQRWKNISAAPRERSVSWRAVAAWSTSKLGRLPPSSPCPGGCSSPPGSSGLPCCRSTPRTSSFSLAQLCAWAWHWWLQNRHLAIQADEAIGISSMRLMNPEQFCNRENRRCYTIPCPRYTLLSHFQMNKWALKCIDAPGTYRFYTIS